MALNYVRLVLWGPIYVLGSFRKAELMKYNFFMVEISLKFAPP